MVLDHAVCAACDEAITACVQSGGGYCSIVCWNHELVSDGELGIIVAVVRVIVRVFFIRAL